MINPHLYQCQLYDIYTESKQFLSNDTFSPQLGSDGMAALMKIYQHILTSAQHLHFCLQIPESIYFTLSLALSSPAHLV